MSGLKPPRRKRRIYQQVDAPFPVPIESITKKPTSSSRWFYYSGQLQDNCVLVQQQGDVIFLYKMGFFGKGMLSKSKPEHNVFLNSYQGLRKKNLPPKERRFQQQRFQQVRKNRYERHLSWSKQFVRQSRSLAQHQDASAFEEIGEDHQGPQTHEEKSEDDGEVIGGTDDAMVAIDDVTAESDDIRCEDITYTSDLAASKFQKTRTDDVRTRTDYITTGTDVAIRTDDVTIRTDDAMVAIDDVTAESDDIRCEDITYTSDLAASKFQITRTDDVRTRTDYITSGTDGITTRTDDAMVAIDVTAESNDIRCEDISTDTIDSATSTFQITTRNDDVRTRTDDVGTRTGDVRTRTGGVTTRTGDVTTRTDGVTTRTGDVTTRTDGAMTSDTDDVTARTDVKAGTKDVTTKTDDVTTETLEETEDGGLIRKEDPYQIHEYLQLKLEEAFFLSYGLGCLTVVDETKKALDLTEMWQAFCSRQRNFVGSYVAYHYYRSKGWVPRDGIKYGAHFVLYKHGPPFYHGSYSVIVQTVTEGSWNSSDANPALTWPALTGMDRITETVAKEVMFCYVIRPSDLSDGDLQSPKCIPRFRVQEILMRRWVSSRERDLKDLLPPLIS